MRNRALASPPRTLHFSLNLGLFPWQTYLSLKGLAMHSVMIFWKKSRFYKNCLTFFHDAIVVHTFMNNNKKLNWNVLQYTILCLQSIFSVYLIIYTNIHLSIFYNRQEIRSHSIQVYSVRYVNISWCTQTTTLLIN